MVEKIDFLEFMPRENYPTEVFETLRNFQLKKKLCLPREIREIIIEHLNELKLSIKKYHSKFEEENNWISNTFDQESLRKATSLSIGEEEQLIVLLCKKTTYTFLVRYLRRI